MRVDYYSVSSLMSLRATERGILLLPQRTLLGHQLVLGAKSMQEELC